MSAVLFARIKSGLDADEFDRRLIERRLRFRDVPGLCRRSTAVMAQPVTCPASTSSRAWRLSKRRRSSTGDVAWPQAASIGIGIGFTAEARA
jgi:hypothetical protein